MRGIRIGRIFGIEIRFDLSLLLFVAIFGYLFSGLFTNLAGISPVLCYIWGFITAIGLIVSILVHELSHSLVARRYKLYVKRITLFLLGGAAKLEGNQFSSPGAEFWIAIAGPAASFGLVGVFWLGAYLCSLLSIGSIWMLSLIRCLSWLSLINLVLGTFNLLPGFPMDGGRILRAGLWKIWKDLVRATKWASRAGQVFAFALMGYGLFLGLQGYLFNAIWIIMIGFFIRNAAIMEYQGLITKRILGGTKAKDILTELHIPRESLPPGAITCKKEELLTTLLEKMKQSSDRLIFVVKNDKVIGTITLEQILKMIAKEKIKR